MKEKRGATYRVFKDNSKYLGFGSLRLKLLI